MGPRSGRKGRRHGDVVRTLRKTVPAVEPRYRGTRRKQTSGDSPTTANARGLTGARTLTGSLPLDLRVVDGEMAVRPAILFAPPHLRAPALTPIDQPMWKTSSASTASGPGKSASKGGAASRSKGTKSVPVAGDGATATQDDGASAVLEAKFADASADLLSDPGAGTPATRMARAADASYDFIEYVLLREPDDPYTFGLAAPYSMAATLMPLGLVGPHPIPTDPRFGRFVAAAGARIATFVNLADPSPSIFPGFSNPAVAAIVAKLFDWWKAVCSVRAFNRLARYDRADIAAKWWNMTPEAYYAAALHSWLDAELLTVSNAIKSGQPDNLAHMYTVKYWQGVLSGVFEDSFKGVKIVDPSAPYMSYPFQPFATDEVLFGLRIVHRQGWHQLAFARGDLVGTVPLGPRETKKVTVKTTRRTKTMRSSEEAVAFETTAEATSTARDTSEVVDEATSKLNRHADAEVGGGYPPYFSAKVSGGLSQDTGQTSKQTKTNLNELMEKSASRIKRDTKVTVATEGETTFEQAGAAELVNPNDEVAITYLYHRLQQRYWVSTQIDEVNSVVFVPEPIPDWNDITEDWIRVHGEIIARSLMDPTFAATVASIRAEPGNLEYPTTKVFEDSAKAAIDSVTDYRTFSGAGDVPDLLGPGQQFFDRDYERRATLELSQKRREHQLRDLITHIQRNILYYMRAIWVSEDPDQRMQRYSGLRVPVSWTFVPNNPLPSGANAGDLLDVDGVFMPDIGSALPLDRVIDPVGPIGYLFNMQIWRVRDDPKLINVHQALAHLRATYTRFAVTVSFGAASSMKLVQAVAVAPRSFSADHTISYSTSLQKWRIQIPGQPSGSWITLTPFKDGSIEVFGIRLWLEGTPTNGETAIVSTRVTGDLEDPHLRLVAVHHPLPGAAQEVDFFNDALLEGMANIFEWPFSVGSLPTWSELTSDQQAEVRRSYHRYLMLRESGRLVTVDSANLVLDLEVGRTAALEPFKRLHRYLDVMKEHEELRRRQFDNTRRRLLLDEGRLADPDIERVAVVAEQRRKVKDLVVLDDGGPDD